MKVLSLTRMMKNCNCVPKNKKLTQQQNFISNKLRNANQSNLSPDDQFPSTAIQKNVRLDNFHASTDM